MKECWGEEICTMKTLLKILGIIAGMVVIGVALTYGILYYLNHIKPTAKKHQLRLRQWKC